MYKRDVVIIGGGPAGLAAALQLRKSGVEDILILEREKQPGGILRQCIHDGFGLTRFGVTLSGPEYSRRFIQEVIALGIECRTNTTVIHLSPEKIVTAVSPDGMLKVQAKVVILTMGCRERTRGALQIPGSRPSGIYTAGVAQSYINLYNTMVGREVIIMGSGDIGMIMARRLTLEGAHVKAVFEVLPYPSGLPRNIEQCLHDYDIPLYLSHSVVRIKGDKRIEGVTVVKVDEKLRPIEGTEKDFSCDTLILSVGLIPENELSREAGVLIDDHTKGAVVDEHFQTSVPGIFAAGNVLHVHDLVDFVSQEAEALAEGVRQYLAENGLEKSALSIHAGSMIGHVIPQKINGKSDFVLSFRVRRPFGRCMVYVTQNGKEVKTMKLPKAIPAEMIQMQITADTLSDDSDVEVMVCE